MACPNLQRVLAFVALGACSCAQPHAPPARVAPSVEAPTRSETTTLTKAEVPAAIPTPLELAPVEPVAMEPSPRWTDAEIVAALGAAQAGRDREAKAARMRSKSVRVDRFAEDVLQQERELERDEVGFTRSMGSLPSDLATRVTEARRAASLSSIDTSELSFDRDFMTAELRYERTLLELIEDEMLPSARSPELRRFLETLRTKTARRISAGEEVESKLP